MWPSTAMVTNMSQNHSKRDIDEERVVFTNYNIRYTQEFVDPVIQNRNHNLLPSYTTNGAYLQGRSSLYPAEVRTSTKKDLKRSLSAVSNWKHCRYSKWKMNKSLLKPYVRGLSEFLLANRAIILKNCWQKEITPSKQKEITSSKAPVLEKTALINANNSRERFVEENHNEKPPETPVSNGLNSYESIMSLDQEKIRDLTKSLTCDKESEYPSQFNLIHSPPNEDLMPHDTARSGVLTEPIRHGGVECEHLHSTSYHEVEASHADSRDVHEGPRDVFMDKAASTGALMAALMVNNTRINTANNTTSVNDESNDISSSKENEKDKHKKSSEKVKDTRTENHKRSRKDSDNKERSRNDCDKKERSRNDCDKKERSRKDSDKKERSRKDSDNKERSRKDRDKKERTRKDSGRIESSKDSNKIEKSTSRKRKVEDMDGKTNSVNTAEKSHKDKNAPEKATEGLLLRIKEEPQDPPMEMDFSETETFAETEDRVSVNVDTERPLLHIKKEATEMPLLHIKEEPTEMPLLHIKEEPTDAHAMEMEEHEVNNVENSEPGQKKKEYLEKCVRLYIPPQESTKDIWQLLKTTMEDTCELQWMVNTNYPELYMKEVNFRFFLIKMCNSPMDAYASMVQYPELKDFMTVSIKSE